MAQVNPMIRPAYQQIAPGVWMITETARAGGLYRVTLRSGVYRCTCPDHYWRRRYCRHILQIAQSLSQPEAQAQTSDARQSVS